jgi:hypothetical protein
MNRDPKTNREMISVSEFFNWNTKGKNLKGNLQQKRKNELNEVRKKLFLEQPTRIAGTPPRPTGIVLEGRPVSRAGSLERSNERIRRRPQIYLNKRARHTVTGGRATARLITTNREEPSLREVDTRAGQNPKKL